MSKIVVTEFLSLDGVMEAPETWHFPYNVGDMQAFTTGQILDADAMLYGRVTYDTFASFWPTRTHNEFGFADHLNSIPKYVISSTLAKADWNNSAVLKGKAVDEVVKLKQQRDGIIGMTGSAMLIQSLLEAGLIDVLHLMIHPIVVGHGKRLFKDGTNNIPLKLAESRTFQSGVVLLTYEPANT